MDKVRGNINGFSFATSPCPCRGLIIRECQWYSWPRMLKVARYTVGRTVVRSYISIFSAQWVITILYNYGATLCELRLHTVNLFIVLIQNLEIR